MIDIYRELTEIIMSNYGITMREPMVSALNKLVAPFEDSEEVDKVVQFANDILDSSPSKGWSGDVTIDRFVKAALYVRTLTKNDSADEYVELFRTTNLGKELRESCYTILKRLSKTVDEPVLSELYLGEGPVILYAGNYDSMFKEVDGENPGINVIGTPYGIGTYVESLNLYRITVKVTNLLENSSFSQTIAIDEPLYENDILTFFSKDQLTAYIDPGIIEIEVVGEPDAIIGTIYNKFGMKSVSGEMITGEDDYIYSSDEISSETIRYLSDYEKIKIPETLDGKPLTVIGNATFMNKNLESVTVPKGIIRIE